MNGALRKRFEPMKGMLEKVCQELASGQSGISGLQNS